MLEKLEATKNINNTKKTSNANLEKQNGTILMKSSMQVLKRIVLNHSGTI